MLWLFTGASHPYGPKATAVTQWARSPPFLAVRAWNHPGSPGGPRLLGLSPLLASGTWGFLFLA